MNIAAALSALTIIAIVIVAIYRHQCLLRDRAQLMRDAMRHRDFSFRLPTKGMLFGERFAGCTERYGSRH